MVCTQAWAQEYITRVYTQREKEKRHEIYLEISGLSKNGTSNQLVCAVKCWGVHQCAIDLMLIGRVKRNQCRHHGWWYQSFGNSSSGKELLLVWLPTNLLLFTCHRSAAILSGLQFKWRNSRASIPYTRRTVAYIVDLSVHPSYFACVPWHETSTGSKFNDVHFHFG